MVLNPDRRLTPDLTVVLKLAHQFLFLAVHADHGIAPLAKLLPLISQIAELLVAVGTAGTETFAIGVQGVAQFLQQTADGVLLRKPKYEPLISLGVLRIRV